MNFCHLLAGNSVFIQFGYGIYDGVVRSSNVVVSKNVVRNFLFWVYITSKSYFEALNGTDIRYTPPTVQPPCYVPPFGGFGDWRSHVEGLVRPDVIVLFEP